MDMAPLYDQKCGTFSACIQYLSYSYGGFSFQAPSCGGSVPVKPRIHPFVQISDEEGLVWLSSSGFAQQILMVVVRANPTLDRSARHVLADLSAMKL